MRITRTLTAGTVVALMLCGCRAEATIGTSPGSTAHAAGAAASSTPAGSSTAEGSSPHGPGAGERFLDAAWQAKDSLVRVHLPHGAELQYEPVPAELLRLPETHPAATAVRLAQWYFVPLDITALEAFVASHQVGGYTRQPEEGSWAVAEVRFRFLPRSSEASPGDAVTESIATVGGRTALLVQADVSWHGSAQGSDHVPVGLTSASLVSGFPRGSGGVQRQALHGKALLGILQALDEATPAGTSPRTCRRPMPSQAIITVDFLGSRIVAHEAAGSCGKVTVTTDGVGERRASLAAPALRAAVARALAGSKLVEFPPPASYVHSAAAARSVGRQVLDSVVRPGGAELVAAAPPGLRMQGLVRVTSHMVDVVKYWRTTNAADLNGYLLALPIPGFTPSFGETDSPGGLTAAVWDASATPSGQAASVGIEWIGNDHGTVDVRVDAFIPWTAPHR